MNDNLKLIKVRGSWLLAISILYIILPTVLFLLGWVEPFFAIPVVIGIFFFAVRCYKLSAKKDLIFTKDSFKALILCILLALLWLSCSGIMGVVQQHEDYVVRNAIYQTLIRCDWPLIDSSGQHFIYYLAFWLPPAALCKLLHIQNVIARDVMLFIYIYVGIMLILLHIWHLFAKYTVIFLFIVIFIGPASGIVHWGSYLFPLDEITGSQLRVHAFPFYSANCLTYQLFYTFHHTIIPWLFLAMLVTNAIKSRFILFLSTFCVLVSPLASIGIFIVIVSKIWKNRERIQSYCTSYSLVVSFAVLFCAALYFTTSPGNNSVRFTWFESPFEHMENGGLKQAILASCYFALNVIPIYFLFKKQKNNYLLVSSIIIFVSCFILYIGNSYGYNEYMFKCSTVCYFNIAIILTGILKERKYSLRWFALCGIYMTVASLNSISALAKSGKTIAIHPDSMLNNMQDRWQGHLCHPADSYYYQFWSKDINVCASKLFISESGGASKCATSFLVTGKTCIDDETSK